MNDFQFENYLYMVYLSAIALDSCIKDDDFYGIRDQLIAERLGYV